MYHVFNIETQRNTTRENPLETDMILPLGVIYKVRIRFPPGSAGKLGLQVFHLLHQLFPSNPDGFFCGDDEIIEFKEKYELTKEENVLVAKTWNESEYFSHSVIISFNVLPIEFAYPLSYKPKKKFAWF